MNVKNLLKIALLTVGVLVIPLIATFSSSNFNWDLQDFLVAGILLFGLGLGIELVRLKVKKENYRYLLYFSLVFLFLLVFIEMAVGIFGSPLAGS